MIRTFDGNTPKIHPKAFVHDSAEVIGKVSVGPGASIWPMAVLRGDIDRIAVGEGSNIQDGCVLHTRRGSPALIGRRVTVGHGAVLHGAAVADDCLIGMGAVVMEAAIGRGSVVGAGAVVPAGLKVPPGSLVLGVPAKVVKKLHRDSIKEIRGSAATYARLADTTRKSSRVVFQP
ncbi:MAG: gamma carbonic anhydrase family protein [Elusimicrobiota bacterium]|jgi:carbonic anhydrase/acetyltransferase-like protein (isoleucine patch superfamily)